MIFSGKADEYLVLSDIDIHHRGLVKEIKQDTLCIIWNKEGETSLRIDDVIYTLKANEMLFLTEFNKTEILSLGDARMVQFNKAFYCILDHDDEVGCKGILFFGAEDVPVIKIPEAELEKFEILWKMFQMEMKSRDKLQIEMLQMMLKRLLILCTRLFKDQHNVQQMNDSQLDIVREFNFLVERYFRQKHNVVDYAEMLHRSPKTLSNYFSLYNHKTPLQVIQHRILLEARRLLHYSDLAIKEIGYELGFDDIQSFSRFFRNKQGISPTAYRSNSAKQTLRGKN
jgi:AraC-like DNA-binding protein